MEVEQTPSITENETSHTFTDDPNEEKRNREKTQSEVVKIRGGGCITSTICDKDATQKPAHQHELHIPAQEIQLAEQAEEPSSSQEQLQPVHTSWPGWAELENDPDIFTILLQEWGIENVQVNEVYDITDLLDAQASSIFGLIFLSRYVSSDQTEKPTSSSSTEILSQQPWFANQISKFSCGTVALMNILMNIESTEASLSEVLTTFKSSTNHMNAKHKGVALDDHAGFRDIHNSFSTQLDQYIVDMLLKEEVSKAKKRASAQAATKKRKRAGGNFTKRRKKKQRADEEEEEENGFHFVAYVSAHGQVWRLDGMQASPKLVGAIGEGEPWLNVTVQDVMPLLQEAFNTGQECTMMSVAKSGGTNVISDEEKIRKQEDWAPFIETLVRIHAERGDLNEMLAS